MFKAATVNALILSLGTAAAFTGQIPSGTFLSVDGATVILVFHGIFSHSFSIMMMIAQPLFPVE